MYLSAAGIIKDYLMFSSLISVKTCGNYDENGVLCDANSTLNPFILYGPINLHNTTFNNTIKGT